MDITVNGEYSGILTKNDLIRGLNIYGKEGKIKEVVSKDIDPASPDQPLFEVFLEMHKKKHEMMPVIKDGNLTGILDMESINEFFLIRKALK